MEIGIDMTTIGRFENAKERLINRILTKNEKDEFLNLPKENKATFLAIHWAVKEAIFKATQDCNYLSYEIQKNSDGKPFVVHHPELKISISHEKNSVIAIALYCG